MISWLREKFLRAVARHCRSHGHSRQYNPRGTHRHYIHFHCHSILFLRFRSGNPVHRISFSPACRRLLGRTRTRGRIRCGATVVNRRRFLVMTSWFRGDARGPYGHRRHEYPKHHQCYSCHALIPLSSHPSKVICSICPVTGSSGAYVPICYSCVTVVLQIREMFALMRSPFS